MRHDVERPKEAIGAIISKKAWRVQPARPVSAAGVGRGNPGTDAARLARPAGNGLPATST
jgi:hypothetical protein